MDATYVSITTEEYRRLIERDEFLSALEQAGVDNWDGYGQAWDIFESEEEDN